VDLLDLLRLERVRRRRADEQPAVAHFVDGPEQQDYRNDAPDHMGRFGRLGTIASLCSSTRQRLYRFLLNAMASRQSHREYRFGLVRPGFDRSAMAFGNFSRNI